MTAFMVIDDTSLIYCMLIRRIAMLCRQSKTKSHRGKNMFKRLIVFTIAALIATPSFAAFKLVKGDNVVYIGNVLAERMQQEGFLETYVQQSMPSLAVSFRNNGFCGDKVDKRPRNKGFMNPHDYLTHCKATVVFAFFGYNEIYENNPDRFRDNLMKWIDETKGKNYSGKGAPRIVLFSPIAHEDLKSPNLPNGKANNARLAAYTNAMMAAAKEKKVAFVDLFNPSMDLYEKHGAPLTINGIHLNPLGNRLVARAAYQGLFGKPAPSDSRQTEKLRGVVIDKNWHWFNRYRATDGNDVWGGRSKLHGNRQTLQRELQQLDVMCANRDKRIWAVARGRDIKVDDSNVPESDKVVTNFKSPKLKKQGGVSKTGTLDYLSPSESISKLKLAKGLKANVFASEEMFPELVNPVQMAVDTKGRLWVAAWKTYPKWEPTKKMDDRLLILPDENRDGVADKAITFAYVHNPTGFEFWNGGVLVGSAPDIIFLKDTDGDDVADVRISMLHGIDSADTHHTMNAFVYGPDGHIYYQRGVFHVSNVETPWGPNQQSGTSGMYRFNPRTYEFSFHASNSPNPHGVSFDYWGYHYATDGTGGRAYQVKPTGKGFKMRSLLKKTVRPVPASGILNSDHFPERYNRTFLICNAIAFLGIKQYTLAYNTENGDVNGTEIEDLLVSDDRNFRPTDFEVGDDGAVYVSDWANAIVGHMQHNIRDPSRDHAHGRIVRVTAEGRPLSKHVQIDGEPIAKLLDLLKHPINHVRYRTRIELSERPTRAVMGALRRWVRQFDPKKKEDAHHLMEALWLHQQHNVKNIKLLNQMLNSPEPHARIAAKTVKQFWDRDPYALVKAEGDAHETADDSALEAQGVIVIRTVEEQMRYDKTYLAVKAGTKVKILLRNNDFMPHNLIVAQPGSARELGTAAEAMGAKGFEIGFIPDSNKIIATSKMIDYRESDLIEFTAPNKPGEYDYLCTFPGHWTLMRGTMKVVATDAELAAAKAAAPKELNDWSLADLADDVQGIKGGRSHAKGKAAFEKLGCAQCHKLDVKSEGGSLGPALAETVKKYKGDRKQILAQILDPSAAVDDKYKAWEIHTVLGERLFGLVTSKGKDHLMVVTNPQNPVPQKIMLDDVDSHSPSTSSLMPRGLLNHLDKNQVLDLMAYIEANGQANHKLFK